MESDWTNTHLSLEEIKKRLGADHVEHILGKEHPELFCDCRADGWWMANDGESYCAYRSLARAIRAGEVSPRA
jgi:hypothetical protein